MSRFKDKLLAAVGSELAALGYEYDDALRAQDWYFGFRKQLTNDTYALITFQVTKYNHYSFYVNLSRHNTSDRDEYQEFVLRLGWVICVSYQGRRRCPPDEDIWNAIDEQDLNTKFADALEKLRAYGIPFLEDPGSKYPTPLRDWEILQFRESVSQIVLPELEKLGFVFLEPRPSEEHMACFAKQIFSDLRMFVVLLLFPGENEGELGFGVELIRHHGVEPFIWPQEDGILRTDLDRLLGRKYGPRMGSLVSPPVRRYTSAKELERQLEDVVTKITEYALPWLEDPRSTMVDLFPNIGHWR